MADVNAVFGTLLALGIVFPGLLTTWWLLFPVSVERARVRFARTPWACLGLGLLGMVVILVPIGLLESLPFSAAKFIGTMMIFAGLAYASVGAAGLASEMGERLTRQSGGKFTPVGGMVRGAVALELAAAFPVLGWFLIIPLVTITAFGATTFAVLRWSPHSARRPAPEPALSQA